jgi:NADH:ubiquinone oxidoreductase subunit 6 (subunit J)
VALCCFGLAGLYYFLHSPFLALMEILIYVGAICVTIVFAVMLAEPDEPPRPAKPPGSAGWLWGGARSWSAARVFWAPRPAGVGHPGRTGGCGHERRHREDIGVSLLTTYSLAFEAHLARAARRHPRRAGHRPHGRTKRMNPAPLCNNRRFYLVLAAFLFAAGVYGLIRRRTLIGMLIAGELIFSAASLNFMAFNRFFAPRSGGGAGRRPLHHGPRRRRSRDRPEHHHRRLPQLPLHPTPRTCPN